MGSHKRTIVRILLSANGSCGCGRPKPTDVLEPQPRRPNPNPIASFPCSTPTSADRNSVHSVDEDDGDITSTTVSEAETEARRSWKNGSNYMLPKQSPIVDSVAVEKESEDPYKDFRHSMLQMIFEKEMCSESDLEELVEAFLQLNSPRQHDVIMKAFTEICKEAFPSDNSKKHVRKGPLARA